MNNVILMSIVILSFALFGYVYYLTIKGFMKSKTEEDRIFFQSLPLFSFITIMNGLFWIVNTIGGKQSAMVGWAIIGGTILEFILTIIAMVGLIITGMIQAQKDGQEFLKMTSFAWIIGLFFWILLKALFFLPIVMVVWILIKTIINKIKPKKGTDIENNIEVEDDNKIEW